MEGTSQDIININKNYNKDNLHLNKNKKNFYTNHIHNYSNDNKTIKSIKSNDSLFHYSLNYEDYLKLNAKSFKYLISQKKITFERITNSITKIINKYKDDSLSNVYYKSKTDPINKTTNIYINDIAEHLLNIFSKHELNLINQRIDYLSRNKEKAEIKKYNKKTYINNTQKTITSFSKKKNILKKVINNRKKTKPVKIKNTNFRKKNREDLNFSDDEDINYNFKPEFYSYIKHKTKLKSLGDLMISNIKNIRKNTFIEKSAESSSSKRNNKSKIKYKTNNDKLFNSINKNYGNNLTPIISRNKTEFRFFEHKKNTQITYCTYKNNSKEKYVNHNYDYIKSIYRNDSKLLERIKEQNEKKIKRLEEIKRENEMKKIKECTFSPLINKSKTKKSYDNKLNNKINISNNNYKHVKDNKLKNNIKKKYE